MALHLPSFVKQLPYDYVLNDTLSLLLLFFITTVVVSKITRRRKWNLPPSPPKLPIIGHFHLLGTLPHRSFQALSQKYGPLLLLQLGQLPVLLVSSVDLAREVYESHDETFANRPKTTAAKILTYEFENVGFAPYGEEWRLKKKLCVVELLSTRKVKSVQFIREEEADSLVSKIHNACLSNKGCPVNLSEMIFITANNIVCRCLFGEKYDSAANAKYRFGELSRDSMIQVSEFAWGDLYPLLSWVDVLTGQTKKYEATRDAMDVFFEHVIAEHRKPKKDFQKNNDFLDTLLQLQDNHKLEFELTTVEIKALILDMFLGGSDTTSTTLDWAMAELLKNSDKMKKVKEEVRRVVGKKSKIEESDINQMEYLKCVVKETFRLHPPGCLLAPRVTSSPVKLGGYDIPDKTMVYVNAYAIQRDPKYWERPDEFIPERFENSNVTFMGQDFQFIPFGFGKRKCPGTSFGPASIEFVLANLLYWFDWNLPNSGEFGQELDMTEKYGLTTGKKVPLYLVPTPNPNL